MADKGERGSSKKSLKRTKLFRVYADKAQVWEVGGANADND